MSKWVKVGEIGVDAGLCWVGDPCYIIHAENTPKELGKDWAEFCKNLWKKEEVSKNRGAQFNYDKGHPGLGVVVPAGFGDGCYNVYAKFSDEGSWGQRVAEVKVVFIEDNDD